MLLFITRPLTPEIYTLSLHDALPISPAIEIEMEHRLTTDHQELRKAVFEQRVDRSEAGLDRKSTRLNSSHRCISYAVFCLKKKKNKIKKRYKCKKLTISY